MAPTNVRNPRLAGGAKEWVTPKGGTREFPLTLDLQFKIQSPRAAAAGAGRTVLMGSREIVFRTDRTILTGTRLELAIAWPALLADDIGLKLIVVGWVADAQGDFITVSINKYEFRTRALAGGRHALGDLAARS